MAQMAFSKPTQRSDRPPISMENPPVSQKTNHVSTVLLCGIPIVSLYIERQERLCLAQISNTLLKQFSYNEIHNRRVALGITCVQCTPVQLEILRRAGAMPVSSRRCGMITRREAERLCKSFLGDNTPPRLPEDFAFSVQHKCAWGCRGLFMPSRYNSSRAKCIKCSFCGMFFSPNKFIFHSHRITTSDRYIQPDAANFNSWRRHMTLCGNTHDEKIIHAWEDVKAMFNGGTRKRLVGPNPSNSSNNNNNNNYNDNKNNNNKNNIDITNNKSANNNRNQSSLEANASAVDESACHSLLGGSDRQITICEETTCSKRTSIDHQYNYSTVAAAAVVGVTAVTTVPFNLHHSSLQSLRNEHDLSILPLSRNFVVDYMWHQQNNHNIPKKLIAGSDSFTGLESCPWIRPELSVASPATVACNTHQHQHGHHQLKTQVQINLKHETSPTAAFGVMKNRKLHLPDTTDSREISEFNIPSLLSSSAFKPVVGSAAVVSTSLYTARDSNSSSSTYIGPRQSTRTSTVLTHDCITSGTHRLLPVGNADATTVSGSDPSTGVGAILNTTSSVFLPTAPILTEQQNFAINNNERASNDLIDGKLEDDEEMVDIETTEDEAHDNSFNNFPPAVSSLSPIHSRSESPNVDVDGFTSDPDRDDHLDFKTHIRSFDNVKMYTQDKSEYKLDPLDSLDNEDDIYQEYTKTSEDSSGLNVYYNRLTRRRCLDKIKERHLLKKGTFKIDNESLFSKSVCTQPYSHIQQRVSFPVFIKSHVESFRHHQQQQSPNSLGSPSKTTLLLRNDS